MGWSVYMGSGPRFHPASSQSWGSGQSLPFGTDANHQQSCRWLASHLLLGSGCVGCSYTPQWADRAFKGSLLQGFHGHWSDSVVCAQRQAKPSLTRCSHWCQSSLPCSTAGKYSWQGWSSIDDLWHPALSSLACMLGGYYQYIHQSSTHKDTHGISQPWPIWGWETPVNRWGSRLQPLHQSSTHKDTHGISQPWPIWGRETPVNRWGSRFQPLSNSYWHRLGQHQSHHHESDRWQPPGQTHKHQYGAWKAS